MMVTLLSYWDCYVKLANALESSLGMMVTLLSYWDCYRQNPEC